MVIRGFDKYLADNRLIATSPLSSLRGARLGMDGAHWLRKIQKSMSDREPLVVATGGVPLGLRRAVERELQGFKEAGIAPYLVFNGLTTVRRDRPFSAQDTRPAARAEGWAYYHRGQPDAAAARWNSQTFPISDLVNHTLRVLHEHHVDFIRAPYFAAAQLVYLDSSPKNFIHGIYAGSDILMYRPCRTIISIDFEKGTFEWVDGKAVLESLHVPPDSFLDACLLCGGLDFNATFPGFTNPGNFRECLGMIESAFGAEPLIMQLQQGPAYMETYLRGLDTVRCHPYLDDSGVLDLLGHESRGNTEAVFGPRFPDQVYYLLCQGLVSPQVLNTLVTGMLVELPPHCNGETRECQEHLRGLLELRTANVGLVSFCLSRAIKDRPVNAFHWFENGGGETGLLMAHSEMSPSVLLERAVPDLPQDATSADFVTCAQIFPPKRPPVSAYLDESTTVQFIGRVLTKALEARSFIYEGTKPTPLGEALTAASPEFHEEMLMFIELLRQSRVHGSPFSHPSVAQLPAVSEAQRLLTRVFTLLPVRCKGASGWSGLVDYDLLCFNSIVRAQERTLRNLCEMLALALVLTQSRSHARADVREAFFGLPFGRETSTALGLVLRYHLEHCGEGGYVAEERLRAAFPACEDPAGDLRRGVAFWSEAVKCVGLLRTSSPGLIADRLQQQFAEASSLLATASRV